MSRPDFSALVRFQPWYAVDLQYDNWYQYAVCIKTSFPNRRISTHENHPSAQLNQQPTWSTV